MLELTREQRRVLADKPPDFANVAAGALVFGQFLGDRGYSVELAVAGMVLWVFLVACAVVLSGDGQS